MINPRSTQFWYCFAVIISNVADDDDSIRLFYTFTTATPSNRVVYREGSENQKERNSRSLSYILPRENCRTVVSERKCVRVLK